MDEMLTMKKTPVPSIKEVAESGRRPYANKVSGSLQCLNWAASKGPMMHILPFPFMHSNEFSAEPLDSKGKQNFLTLPSRLAIPVGIAQIVVGGSMVCCGTFALRYQSYLFYYGSGLWAGLLAGLAGILAVMATKTGLPKPKWFCGGRKWQIRIFLMTVIMALTAAVLTAIFSTTGLVRDTQYDYSKRVVEMTADEKMYEKRKSSGIAITAILLLLALLEILLCFCSLGITLKVVCLNSYYKRQFLIRDSSDGSDVTKKEITGQEYQAKTDRLISWLGHQKRQYFSRQLKEPMAQKIKRHPHQTPARPHLEPRLYPRLIPARAQIQIPVHQQCNPLGFPRPFSLGNRNRILGPQGMPPLFPFRSPLIMSLPLPMPRPRSLGPPSIANSSIKQCRVARYSVNSLPERRSASALVPTLQKEKSREVTEEDVEKTYTGLDREIAEKFISNAMNSH